MEIQVVDHGVRVRVLELFQEWLWTMAMKLLEVKSLVGDTPNMFEAALVHALEAEEK